MKADHVEMTRDDILDRLLMTHVRVKGFKIFKDRHGRMRCYHRATGHKIDLTEAPLGSGRISGAMRNDPRHRRGAEGERPSCGHAWRG